VSDSEPTADDLKHLWSWWASLRLRQVMRDAVSYHNSEFTIDDALVGISERLIPKHNGISSDLGRLSSCGFIRDTGKRVWSRHRGLRRRRVKVWCVHKETDEDKLGWRVLMDGGQRVLQRKEGGSWVDVWRLSVPVFDDVYAAMSVIMKQV